METVPNYSDKSNHKIRDQKIMKSSPIKLYHVFSTTVETNTTCFIPKFQYHEMQVNEDLCLRKLETKH